MRPDGSSETMITETMMDWFEEQMKNPEFADAFAADWIGETIAVAFENRMKTLGMNQTQLAERLGCSQPNVSRWFRVPGAMSLRTVARICRILELDLAVVAGAPGTVR